MQYMIRFLILPVIIFVTATLLLPMQASAQLFQGSTNEACKGATLDGTGDCDSISANSGIRDFARRGIELFSFVIGIIAVIMIIIGGIRYVTSGGDPTSTKGAKDTIIYALVGLVIAALAQVIVRFVLKQVTDPPVEEETSFLIIEIFGLMV